VGSYAETCQIPVLRLAKGQRKVDMMRPLMAEAAAQGRSRVVAIVWAQEFVQVTAAATTHTESGNPQFTFGRAARPVSCVYFYL
jgi:hypothetical protein